MIWIVIIFIALAAYAFGYEIGYFSGRDSGEKKMATHILTRMKADGMSKKQVEDMLLKSRKDYTP